MPGDLISYMKTSWVWEEGRGLGQEEREGELTTMKTFQKRECCRKWF